MSPTAYSGFKPPAALVTGVKALTISGQQIAMKETYGLWYQHP